MGPGLPEKVAKEDLDLNNFFGFVEVKVKSKVDMLHKKPLHALYEGGKLMFRHFSEPTTIILFSEELKCGVKSGMYEYEIVRGDVTICKTDVVAQPEFFFGDFEKRISAGLFRTFS